MTPNAERFETKTREFMATIPAAPGSWECLPRLLGTVNRADFAGHPAGHLLLDRFTLLLDEYTSMSREGKKRIEVRFLRNDSRPWNEIVDGDGRPVLVDGMYGATDFREIDGYTDILTLEEVSKAATPKG